MGQELVSLIYHGIKNLFHITIATFQSRRWSIFHSYRGPLVVALRGGLGPLMFFLPAMLCSVLGSVLGLFKRLRCPYPVFSAQAFLL